MPPPSPPPPSPSPPPEIATAEVDQHGRPKRSNRGVPPPRFNATPTGQPERPCTAHAQAPTDSDTSPVMVQLPTASSLPTIPSTTSTPQPLLPRSEPADAFGLRREYYGPPPRRTNNSANPSLGHEVIHPKDNDLADVETSRLEAEKALYAPYPNESAALLGSWWFANETKSINDLHRLCDEIFALKSFDSKAVVGTKWGPIFAKMKDDSTASIFDTKDGWKKVPIYVNVPRKKQPPLRWEGPIFRHKSLLGLMETVCQSEDSKAFCWQPHALFWSNPNDPDAPEISVHHEIYNSPDFITEFLKIQSLPGADIDPYERVVVPLLPSSDGTHLSAFGNATAWPGYMAFGLQSKYKRGETSQHALHHFAHFPKVCSHSYLVNIHLLTEF